MGTVASSLRNPKEVRAKRGLVWGSLGKMWD